MFALAVLCGILGASLGSFLIFVARGETNYGRSHCACGRDLKWYERVPILGWLRVKGTAKCCGSKLSEEIFSLETLLYVAIFAILFVAFFPLGISYLRRDFSILNIMVAIEVSAFFLLESYYSTRNRVRKRREKQ